MNLSQLRFANAVAIAGSFTAAAEKCGVTQPTLSNGIAQLEGELGARLFTRTTRRVALTSFGAHIRPFITSVLNAQDNLIHQAESFLRPTSCLVRIGSSPLISAVQLGLLLEPFRSQYPDVAVVLRQMNMRDLESMLSDGSLDFVLTVADSQRGSWVAAALYEEPLLFVPRGATWTGPRPLAVRFKDIAAETFVMVPDACGLARATRGLFRHHRRKLHVYAGEAMSYQVLEEWAVLGLGAAILPRSKLTATASSALPISDKSNREVTIAFEARWRRAATQAPHLRQLAEHLRTARTAIPLQAVSNRADGAARSAPPGGPRNHSE